MTPADRDARIKAIKRTLRGMGPALEAARIRTKSVRGRVNYGKCCRKNPRFRAYEEASGAYVKTKRQYDELAHELAGLQQQARRAQKKAARRRSRQLPLFLEAAA